MSRTLLLADDSITIQRVVELTFAGQDIKVITAGDGEQAIQRISADRPDIVIADIGMPRRTGYEVSAYVKGRPDLAHVPVLLLAGAFEPVDEVRAREVKCDGVLVKPFEPQQVISRVRDLLGEGTPVMPATPEAEPETYDVSPVGSLSIEEAAPAPATSSSEAGPMGDGGVGAEAVRTGSASPDPVPGSLDDYFDRLDAAFASLSHSASRPSLAAPLDEAVDATATGDALPAPETAPLPTVDEVLRRAALTDVDELLQPEGLTTFAMETDGERSADGSLLAEAFTQILAREQGDSTAVIPRIGGASTAVPVITDDLLDQLTRRVAERLAPDAARAVVVEVVSEVAERLVREEIDRIRQAARG